MRAPDLTEIAEQCRQQVEDELKSKMRHVRWLERLSLRLQQRPHGNRVSDVMLISYIRQTAPEDAELNHINRMGNYVQYLYRQEFRNAQAMNCMDLHWVIEQALNPEKAQDERKGSL